MITYNNKDWFTFVFRFRRGDTVRKLWPLIISISAYTALITFLELDIFNLKANSQLRNLGQMHTLLSFVISMLLVFRTNTAYERWWEGRKLWGQLINHSRNLAMKINAMLDPGNQAEREFFKQIIPLYAMTLHHHLRQEVTRLALDENLDPQLQHLSKDKHMPNQVASMITKRTNQLYTEGKITGDQLIIMSHEVRAFIEICGACERIKNTPIPYSYSTFLKKFIFFYVMTLPFSFSMVLGWGAIPVVAFIFFVLASLELIAEEIEDPFSGDLNDLPTLKMSENITKHIGEIME